MTAHLKWFEIFRVPAGEAQGAYVRTHSARAAVMRYTRRCGGDPEDFDAIEVGAPEGGVAA